MKTINFIVIRPIKATQNRVGCLPIILATQEAEQKGQGFSSAQVKLSKNPISNTSKPGVVIECLWSQLLEGQGLLGRRIKVWFVAQVIRASLNPESIP
jgi:hypothetical protein